MCAYQLACSMRHACFIQQTAFATRATLCSMALGHVTKCRAVPLKPGPRRRGATLQVRAPKIEWRKRVGGALHPPLSVSHTPAPQAIGRPCSARICASGVARGRPKRACHPQHSAPAVAWDSTAFPRLGCRNCTAVTLSKRCTSVGSTCTSPDCDDRHQLRPHCVGRELGAATAVCAWAPVATAVCAWAPVATAVCAWAPVATAVCAWAPVATAVCAWAPVATAVSVWTPVAVADWGDTLLQTTRLHLQAIDKLECGTLLPACRTEHHGSCCQTDRHRWSRRAASQHACMAPACSPVPLP
jgi:hypothetical protein